MRKVRSDLINIRLQLNMNQSEFAKKLGIDQSQLATYESGRRSPISTTWRMMVLSARQFRIDLPESIFLKEEEQISEEIFFKASTVKQMREYLGKDQIEVAKELGIHPRRWGRYERGENSPPAVLWIKIKRYAKRFGIQLGAA